MTRAAAAIAALMFAAPLALAKGPGVHHGPPDTYPKRPTVCEIPRAVGGGRCATGPFVRVGQDCICATPHGEHHGFVVWKQE